MNSIIVMREASFISWGIAGKKTKPEKNNTGVGHEEGRNADGISFGHPSAIFHPGRDLKGNS